MTTATEQGVEPQAISERLQEGYQLAEHQIGQMRERLEEANHQAIGFIQDKPVVALAASFAVGYLIGRLALRRWLR